MTAYTQAVQAMVAAAGSILLEKSYGYLYSRADDALKKFIQDEIDIINKKEDSNG